MFQPHGLPILTEPAPKPQVLTTSSLDIILGRPDFRELPPRAQRVPIEIYYEALRNDFEVNKVVPGELEVGDHFWAHDSWLTTMEADTVVAIEPEIKQGQYRFLISAKVGQTRRVFHCTLPYDKEVWVIDWPLYRLAKFGDVEQIEVSRMLGSLTRGAYNYNGMCWFAHLSPYQRLKVFGSGLFSTMVRTTLIMTIPRAF